MALQIEYGEHTEAYARIAQMKPFKATMDIQVNVYASKDSYDAGDMPVQPMNLKVAHDPEGAGVYTQAYTNLKLEEPFLSAKDV